MGGGDNQKRGRDYGGFKGRGKGNSRRQGNEMPSTSLCPSPIVNISYACYLSPFSRKYCLTEDSLKQMLL